MGTCCGEPSLSVLSPSRWARPTFVLDNANSSIKNDGELKEDLSGEVLHLDPWFPWYVW